ncbi:MAG TPA: DNA repair protein RecN [Tenuifilaceae bacterium]|nr:DNA repair protein RecN [Tenuifilaceae bacterium]HPJ46552.1 DNA repair protein RecN [Tenuifilaceae bacterium]HPQ35233.1 DNA repair protein RecN [Tenuifilaceae bacterium]
MLKHLHIQNYALINHLDIEFNKGLNIITGETGAGKSILIGALGLILGQRTDTSVLKDKHKSCIVEALFEVGGYNLQPFFEENDLDYYDSTIIRRQINEAGKSRAFINEIPVNLSVIKDLVGRIIDIHSQHESLLLADSSFQLTVLDSFAGTTSMVNSYSQNYNIYKSLKVELENLKQKEQQAKADFDYLQFQLNQLIEAKLTEGEQEELEEEQQKLSHAEEIKFALQMAANLLNSEEASILGMLKESISSLSKISEFFQPAAELVSRLESCRLELKDISQETDSHFEKIAIDPERLQWVNSRIDTLFSLQQKHRVSSVNELISLREKLQEDVDKIANFDTLIAKKSEQLNTMEAELLKKAKAIGEERIKKSPDLEVEIQKMLKELGMPFASFKVSIIETGNLLPTGTDRVSFLFSANKQISMQEISKVASGGELSRLMLSLKSLMVRTRELPTIIFDEIDTGVSGEVADKMGNIINRIATKMQVINITHLPQIACKGQNHYLVYKDNETETSITRIKKLSSEERLVEIAKMLSGEKITDAAIENAKHLLTSR